jgi:Domain of Unknown Function (DUF1080)
VKTASRDGYLALLMAVPYVRRRGTAAAALAGAVTFAVLGTACGIGTPSGGDTPPPAPPARSGTDRPATGGAETPGGTVALWDGKSLAGWSQAGPGGFAVVDTPDGRVLESRGGLGLLWYAERSFTDYVLSLQWRTSSAGDNSGVFVGFPDPQGDPWSAVADGYEVQIYDGEGGDPQKSASIYDAQPPVAARSHPPGQWNDYEITVRGDTLTVELNGEVVNTFSAGDPERDLAGYVGLQNHGPGDRVQFRDVRLRALQRTG